MLKTCRVQTAHGFCGIMGEGLAEKGSFAEGIERRGTIVLLAERRKVILGCRSKWARCSHVYLLDCLRGKAGSVLEKFKAKSRYSPSPTETLRKSIFYV